MWLWECHARFPTMRDVLCCTMACDVVQGSVNEVDFHPNEPVIGSAGSDKLIFLGELAN